MPTRKVGYGGLAAAISILVVWGLDRAGMNVPAEVASAITTVMSVVTSYFIKENNA